MPPLPKRFWLLPILALVLWWPLEPYWQSDDYLALHYAQDLSRALADFAGPQYGSTDVWLFFRPLITLSFWFDQQLAGTDPFWSHCSNVLAHAVSTLLAALLLRRFLPDRSAFAAALLWSALPSHVGALGWAVGRVDSHTTVWCLGALLAVARHCERQRAGQPAPRWPALLLLLAALCSKELAFVVPPLASLLAMALASQPDQALSFATRLRFATAQTFCLWLLFGGYLLWRWYALSRLGGYLAGSLDPVATARGFVAQLTDLLWPSRWASTPHSRGAGWLLGVPVGLALLGALTRPRLLLGAGLALLVAAAPMVGFFADAGNVHNLRYFYLPSLALVAALAARGWRLPAAAFVTMLLPLLEVRSAQRAADQESARLHEQLQATAAAAPAGPLFVAGLPHQHAGPGRTVQLHFGVDRLLQTPFVPEAATRSLYALRPLAELPGVLRLFPDDAPFALPNGTTWRFAPRDQAFVAAPAPLALPELHVTGDDDGVVDFAADRLLRLATEPGFGFGLQTAPGRPMGHRLTLFTANGYLCCLCFDHGPADAPHGTIDALQLLAGNPATPLEPARYGLLGPAYLGEALDVPTTLDLAPEFPVLIEAGRLENGAFVPSARARRFVSFRFDRGYPAWKRLVQGKG